MSRNELLRKLKRLAKIMNVMYEFRDERGQGKGSHGTVYFGVEKTIVPKGEIKKGTLSGICKKLKIKEIDLNGV